MQMIVRENERIDAVNDGITLIQRTDGLTFGTDALLLAAFINSKESTCVEFGSGTGIISLLLLQRKKAKHIYAYEIQPDFAELTQRNANNNNLGKQITVYCQDVRDSSVSQTGSEVDIVFTNPPYMKNGSGISSATNEKNIARREIHGDIADFCRSAKKLLKYGGKFYCVYRPDRLTELIYSLRSNALEPKRMTFVHADPESAPSLVLIEARYGGGAELKITRPLVLYKDTTHKEFSDDTCYIYEKGYFPDKRF